MDFEELLAPIEPDETPRAVWIIAGIVAVIIVAAVGAIVLMNRSGGEEIATAPLTSGVDGDDASATGGAPDSAPTESLGSTAPPTTLDPSATDPDEALEKAREYISIEGDAAALEQFFASVEYWNSFNVFLRIPEEIGRYVALHDEDTSEFELGAARPTENGRVLIDVDFTWQERARAQVTWEIGIEDGAVVYFKERSR